MSDRIGVMSGGHLEQVGAPQAVYELPATEFVASFLGASNLLQGEVESTNGALATVRLAAGSLVTLPERRLPARRGPVRVGVRPEKLTIGPAGNGTGQRNNSIEATVTISTYTGVATTYECATDDGATVIVYAQNLGTMDRQVAAGQRVRLTWDAEHTFAVEARGGT